MKATLITSDNKRFEITILNSGIDAIVWVDASLNSIRERVFIYEAGWPTVPVFREKKSEVWTANYPLEEELIEQ